MQVVSSFNGSIGWGLLSCAVGGVAMRLSLLSLNE